jgi:hypothetical protein
MRMPSGVCYNKKVFNTDMQNDAISSTGKPLSLFVNSEGPLALRAGDIVSAEVVRVGPNNDAAVRLKNTLLNVTTEVPLQKGDMLSLRVERQENTVYLRLTGNVADSAGGIRNSILSALNELEGLSSGTEGMTKLLALVNALPESLRNELPEIDVINRFLVHVENITGPALKDLVQNGGMFFEAKLRILALGLETDPAASEFEAGRIIAGDLKASLLRLKDAFLSPAVFERMRIAVNTDELLGALNTVFRNIEYYQLQSRLTDTLQFFLPLIWKQLKDGEVIVRQYDHGSPGERSFSCAVNLDLERAGKVRVYLLLQSGYVNVSFGAENPAFVRMLQNSAPALEQSLLSAGLRPGRIEARQQQVVEFEQDPAATGLSIRA